MTKYTRKILKELQTIVISCFRPFAMSCQNLEDSDDLSTFHRWSVDALKDYLRKRGLRTTGPKVELAALAFSAHVLQLPEKLTQTEKQVMLYRQYADLLSFDGSTYPDPLTALKDGWISEKDGMKMWPPTMYYDICEFILNDTKELDLARRVFRDYKEKKGFSFVSSGFLFEIFYHEITKESKVCYLKACCRPSQNINHPPHTSWVMINKESGSINRAYCTCVAGRGQSCLHVAALLMKVDLAWKFGLTNPACTSRECSWLCKPNLTIAPEKICEMEIISPNYSKSTPQRQSKLTCKKLFVPHKGNSRTAFKDFLKSAQEVVPGAVVYSELHEREVTRQQPKSEVPMQLPKTVAQMGKICQTPKQFIEALSAECSGKEYLVALETVRQAKCEVWHEQRKGRVTASVFKDAHTKCQTFTKKGVSDFSDDPLLRKLIHGKEICSKYIKYGVTMEETARTAYEKHMKSTHGHRNFSVKQCGFFIDNENPFIGASPDGLLRCDCHGEGVLEIKCPYTASHTKPDESVCGFLCKKDGVTSLLHSHKYFYQVQGQMGVLGVSYCDFWVFSSYGHHLERIDFDSKFWSRLKASLTTFVKGYLSPAILMQNQHTENVETGAKVTEITQGASAIELEPSSVEVTTTESKDVPDYICKTCCKECKGVEHLISNRENSIGCDLCGSWFHWKCVGLTNKSKELKWPQWLCHSCKDQV